MSIKPFSYETPGGTPPTPITPPSSSGVIKLFEYEKSAKQPEVAPIVAQVPPKVEDPSTFSKFVDSAKRYTSSFIADFSHTVAALSGLPRDIAIYGTKAIKAGSEGMQKAKDAPRSITDPKWGQTRETEAKITPKTQFYQDVIDELGKGKLDNNNWDTKTQSKVKDFGTKLQEKAGVDPYNRTFGENLSGGFGSMTGFFVPSFVVAKTASLLTKTKKASDVYKTVGGTSMVISESLMEGNQVFQDVYEKTGDVQEAQRTADNTVAANIVLIGVTNHFSKYFEATAPGFRNMVKGALTTAISEGPVQEGGQQIISNINSGRPIFEGVKDAAIIGSIVGGVTHMATRGLAPQPTPVVIPKTKGGKKDDEPKDPPPPGTNMFQKLKEKIFSENKGNPVVDEYAKNDKILTDVMAFVNNSKEIETPEQIVAKLVEAGIDKPTAVKIMQESVLRDIRSQANQEATPEQLQTDIINENVRVAMENGGRESAIIGAIKDQYSLTDEEAKAIVDRVVNGSEGGETNNFIPDVANNQEEANEDWENNPVFAEKVGELSQQVSELEQTLKEQKGQEAKKKTQAKIDKINKEIAQVNDGFISKWEKKANEEAKKKTKAKKQVTKIPKDNKDVAKMTTAELRDTSELDIDDETLGTRDALIKRGNLARERLNDYRQENKEVILDKDGAELEVVKLSDNTFQISVSGNIHNAGFGSPFSGEYATKEEAIEAGIERLTTYIEQNKGNKDYSKFKKALATVKVIKKKAKAEATLGTDLGSNANGWSKEEVATEIKKRKKKNPDLKYTAVKHGSNFAILTEKKEVLDNKSDSSSIKGNDKTIQRTARNKRRKVSKTVPDSKRATGADGTTSDGTSEDVLPDGGTDDRGTDLGSNTDGERPVIEDVDTVENPGAEIDYTENVEPVVSAINDEIKDLEVAFEAAPEENKEEIKTAIENAEEKRAEVENTFLSKYEGKEVTNEMIAEAVAEITEIDPKTKQVKVKKGVDSTDLASVTEIVRQFKSGGTTKKGRGILDEYYTDKRIVDAVYSILDVRENASVLEPSIGVGNFVPTNTKNVEGYEINPTTAGIATILNPDIKVFNKSFETNFIDEKGKKKTFEQKYDLVIGNPPYGEHRGLYKGLGEEEGIAKYEDYFTKRGLDVVKEGGKVVFVIPSSFLKTESSKAKEAIAKIGVIDIAFRLPENTFAGTSIGTDIVIFTKATADEKDSTGRLAIQQRVQDMSGDSYFKQYPETVLGDIEARKNRFGKQESFVSGSLDEALSKLNALNINRIAVGIAYEQGIDPTAENIDAIKEVIDESETTDVGTAVKELTEEEKKAKVKADIKTKKIIQKIKQTAAKTTAKQVNLGTVQKEKFTENELTHWLSRNKDGSLPTGFENDPKITSYMDGKWYMDFTYLQGNIYDKLKTLEKDKGDISKTQYEKQKKALEAIKPEVLPLERIRINANSSFLQDFLIRMEKDYRGDDKKISLAEEFMTYVRNEVPTNALGGLSRSDIHGYIFSNSVRGGSADENARIRKYRVIVANELLEKYFADLKENNKDLHNRIETAYNEQYNAIHNPDYSKVPLTITVNNSLNGNTFQLTSVQQEGVGRLVEKGVGILAHDVGFGKTLTAILATYQNMQNGHTKRPLFIVPKATRKQWLKTILEIVPEAKVNDLSNLADGYNGDLSTLKLNDGEFNVVTEEGFKRISFKNETYDKYTDKYAYVADDLTSSKTERENAKQIEQAQVNKGKMVKGSRTDIFFEDLGIDHIIVDEVQNANNIITKIKMPKDSATEFRNISKPANPSIYGVKTWLASQYIQDNNDGKNVYLLSATPFTNSPLQYFSVLSLLANKTMTDMGVDNVNDFLNQFMTTEIRQEYKANGTFKERQVVRNFKNNNLLRKLLGEYIDFKNGEDNPYLIRPTKVQRVNNFAKSQDYISREVEIQQSFGTGKDTLKLIGQLRALALSSTLLKGENPDIKDYKTIVENSPKLYAIAKNIGNNQRVNKKAGRIATEIVYSPIGVEILPILKEYLIKVEGMKPEEIGIITGDAKYTPEKRAETQNDFNGVDAEGKPTETKMRVLMGTDTIGTGLNLQKRTSDIHFLGLPWNFTDLMQVEGRGWRQGNKWANIRMNHYLMENSYDALHFQILTSKQRRYELAIKNNEDVIDVGDVDVEKQLSELITDPNLIAELKLNDARQIIADELRIKTADLSYAKKKIDKIEKIEKELHSNEEYLARAEASLLDKDTSEYMRKYYTEKVDDYKKDIADNKKDIEEQKQAYIENGIDIKAIYEKIDPLQSEVSVLTERLKALDTVETKNKYLEDAKASIKPIVPFELDDVKKVIDSYAKENESFYVERGLPVLEKETLLNSSNVESPKPLIKQEKKTSSNKVVKKTVVKVSPELAVISDTSLTVDQKVTKLLDRKQEGKEYKDVGDRVTGSKKEKATIKTIYKHGGQDMFDEMVKQLGWEAVLETVDKAEIFEQTNAANTIQADYDNKIPAPVAKAKKGLLDSIYRVPKLAGKKKGKWNYEHYSYLVEKDNKYNSAQKEDLIAIAKVYPTTLKQLVNHILSIKDEMPEIIEGDIYIDALGNIVDEGTGSPKYRIEKEAFGFSGKYSKSPRYVIKNAMEGDYLGDGKYEKVTFKASEYESLLNPVVREVVRADDQHGNFEAIDKYDIGDEQIPKEKVKAETLSSDYGFKSVQLGNYMDDASSYEHIQQTMGAIDSMSKALGLDLVKMIATRGLSIAYGARGGGKALAHYEPSRNIINMTKKRGDGSFGHEFMHFLDNNAKTNSGKRLSALFNYNRRYYSSDSAGRNLMKALEHGGYEVKKMFKPNDEKLDDFIDFSHTFSEEEHPEITKPQIAEMIIKAYETDKDLVGKTVNFNNEEGLTMNYGSTVSRKITPQILANLTGEEVEGTELTRESKFAVLSKKHLGNGKDSYWTKNEELLARAFEAYLFDKLERTGTPNNYAVRDNVAQTDKGFIAYAYPQGEEREAFNKLFDRYFETVREEYPVYKEDADKDKVKRMVEIEKELTAMRNAPTDGNYEDRQTLRNEASRLEKELRDAPKYKHKGAVIKGGNDTETKQFLIDFSIRMKATFDVQFFDTILGQAGEGAYGATKDNIIALEKGSPFTTAPHEIVHLTINNLAKIQALSHLKREDILKEQARRMGLSVELYNAPEVEEALALGVEVYKKGGTSLEKVSKIRQLYDFLIDQFRRLADALGRTNNRIIEEYYALLFFGKSVTDEYVDLDMGRSLDEYIVGNKLDFSIKPVRNLVLNSRGVMLKKKLDEVLGDYEGLIKSIADNQEIMGVIAKYTGKTSLSDIVETANEQVSDYVKAVLEVEKIKTEVEDTTDMFLKLVENREKIEDLQNALENKLQKITNKVAVTKKRTKKTTETVVADAIAQEVNDDTGDAELTEEEVKEIPVTTSPSTATELVERMTPIKPKTKGVSAFQNRMLDLLDEQKRKNVEYSVIHKVDEVAKAEAYYKANKKRTIDIAMGKEAPPPDVSHNVISLTVLAKAQEEGDSRTIARVLPKLSLRATRQGQEISMLADAFGEKDAVTYMNRLIAQRKLLAKKKYKPMFSSLEDAKGFEKIVDEKVKSARLRAPKLSGLMEMKAQDIDDFLNEITC